MQDRDDDDAREPASPVCYANEFPEYFGMNAPPDPAVIDRLNALLEAERAGAKVLAIIARGLADDSTEAHARLALPALRDLQKDERDNAVLLFQAIKRAGGAASTRVGDFVEKTLAIDGLVPRLTFVNKGQAWVARKIDELLPMVKDAASASMLLTMRDDHLRNIRACEALVATLHAGRVS